MCSFFKIFRIFIKRNIFPQYSIIFYFNTVIVFCNATFGAVLTSTGAPGSTKTLIVVWGGYIKGRSGWTKL